MSSHGVKTNPLHVSLRCHERSLDGSVRKRACSDWSKSEGSNRVIKWCVLIGSPYTCQKIWLARTVSARWMEKGDAGGSLIKWRVKSEKMVSGSIAFFVVRTEYEHWTRIAVLWRSFFCWHGTMSSTYWRLWMFLFMRDEILYENLEV